MNLSARRSLLIVLAVVGCGATAPVSANAGGMALSLRAAALARPLILRVSPTHVPLGQRFTVLLTGARPGALYTFAMAPRHSAGFGGGLMGGYKASREGVVRFSYPGPTGRWEIGAWRLSAEPRDTRSHLPGVTTTFTVEPRS